MNKRLLYIAPHRPGRSPGQRFRFEQFIPYLEENGFEITYSYIVNAWDDSVLYQKGKYFKKLWIAIKAFIIRIYDVLRANSFDTIIVYREALFVGSTLIERLLAKSKAKLVFDFDDAIWLNDTSEGNSNLQWLKKASKFGKIMSHCDLIIAGNNYLADYASQFNKHVQVIPTTIDSDYYKNGKKSNKYSVCIGWTGSLTTTKHFKTAYPVLKQLKEKYQDKISFLLISDAYDPISDLNVEFIPWNKSSEIDDLNKIDIGIMPLPNDKWSKGKCGFKGIQYMALEKPTVMSPIGVNTEIIQDGTNGFLANDNTQWINKLSMLIESINLREKIGKEGRKTIEKKYSVNAQKNVLLTALLPFPKQ